MRGCLDSEPRTIGNVVQNSGQERSHTPGSDRREAPVDPVLLAKYLDYCSARISEVFLSLSDEQTYKIMEQAAREANLAVGALSFQTMMQLVTRTLRRDVPLPRFEEWAESYRSDPEQYEPYLLGLWESEEEGEDPGDPEERDR
jgi:hypothetical protein